MSQEQKENCPGCLIERGKIVLLQAIETEQGYIWCCPVCGEEFTKEELDEIYRL